MVEDDVFLVALPGGIGSVVDVFLLSTSDAYEADDVVGTRAYREVAQGDARIGGRLSCPRMVTLSLMVMSDCRAMTPATSNTTVRFLLLTAERNEPVPESLRLVTCTTVPPRPPVA